MEGGASIGGGGGGVDAKAFHGAKDGSGLSGAEARHGGQGKEEQPLASGWGKGVGAELAAKKGEATIEQGAVGDSIEAGAVDFIAPLDDGAAPSPDGRDGRCGALKRVGLGWEHGTILARRGNAGNVRWSAEGYGVWGGGGRSGRSGRRTGAGGRNKGCGMAESGLQCGSCWKMTAKPLGLMKRRARRISRRKMMSKISKSWRVREAEGLTGRERTVVGSVELSKTEAPSYPSTPVATWSLLSTEPGSWRVEEKLDGANCAVWIDGDGVARIRDRNRALRKGVQGGGWAKKQFAPLWGRAGEARRGIESIEKALGFRVAIYAEWLLVAHGRCYGAVGDPFRPWGVWSIEHGRFIDPGVAAFELVRAGFEPPRELGVWTRDMGWEAARGMAVGESGLGGAREGAVFKRGDGAWQTGLAKVVDPDFEQGALWNGEDPVFQARG